GGGERSQNRRQDEDGLARELAVAVTPGGQGRRIDPAPDLDAEELEVFAEVKLGTQLRYRLLTLPDRLWGRRRQEPRGQRLLTGPRSGRAQSLEERALAKQVEIGGKRVLDVEILESLHSQAGPPTLQPPQTLGIEVRGSASSVAGPPDR